MFSVLNLKVEMDREGQFGRSELLMPKGICLSVGHFLGNELFL